MMTIKDVHRALTTAGDCIAAVSTVSACLNAGEYHTKYGDEWQRKFGERASTLVRTIAEELGAEWTSLPLDTPLGPKAQEAFLAVREIWPK